MIVVVGTMTVRLDAVDSVVEAMRVMMRASRAEAGCVSYALCEDVTEPGRIHVAEQWESLEALEAHYQSPHMKVWRAALGKAGVAGRDVRIYDGTLVREA